MTGAILTAIVCAICGAVVYTIGAVAGFRRGQYEALSEIYTHRDGEPTGAAEGRRN